MIFYFTGTGNSLQVAKNMAQYHGEEICSISALTQKKKGYYEYTLGNNEKIGFVFPVYAWGAPPMVLDFIEKLRLFNLKDNYVFVVVTCGENIGNTMKAFERHLKKKEIPLHSGFSVVMPNNYMLMGMDVDSKEEVVEKLSKVDKTLEGINQIIGEQKKGVFHLIKGPLPSFVSPIINLLFQKLTVSTKKFYAKDNCITCGICAKVCRTKTIRVQGKPIWGAHCTQCLACINLCPVKAIEYGKGTVKRGRYKNPNVTVEELSM